MEFMIKKIRDLCRERKLQVDIVTVFLLLISCTTLLIISYSYSKTKKSILQFSKSTIQRTNTLILEKVSCRVESSDKLPKTIAAKINDLSEISFKNQDLVAYLKNLTKVYSDLTSFYVGSIDGNVLTSFNLRALNQKTYAINKDKPLPDNIYYALQIVERQSPESYEEYIYYDKDFKLIDSEKSSQISFNPITRPWFFKDIKPKEVRWTKIYTYDINQTLATTVTAGVFDKQGKLIGIAAADLSLDNFSSFLKEQKISTHGLAVILDKETGKVIIPLTFSEEKHPFITDKVIDEGLKSFNSQSNEDLVFEVDGKDYLGGFSTFPLSINDNWLIAVIAPLSDFFSSIIKVQHQVLLISACIFLIAGIFVFIFSKRISKPISILANEIDKIKNFELDSNIRISSNIFEISVLDRSIVAMRSALRSFSKYVPKEIVKELIRKGKDIALGGEKKKHNDHVH